MNISKIIEVTGASISAQQKVETKITTLCFDSRQATQSPNELFIALKGSNQDGHDFIPALIEKGSTNFLVEKDLEVGDHVNIIRVDSCLTAIQQLASYKRIEFEGSVVAITGSNGKTIVKEWLTVLLSTQKKVLSSPKSYNSQLGVPLSVWPISNQYDVGVFEAGISRPEEMEKLEKILKPNIGIFTNIGSAHEEQFESLEQKVLEKLELFKHCNSLIYDCDDKLVSELIEKHYSGEKLNWSKSGTGTIHFTKVDRWIQLEWKDTEYRFSFELTDEASIQNITHAIICALKLGITPESIQQGLNRIKPVQMRLELKRGIQGNFIIDDTYNNDLAGLNKALSFMEQQRSHENKTLILSDFIQSKVSIDDFRNLNELLISKGIDRLIGIGPQLMAAEHCFSLKTHFYQNTEEFMGSDLPDQIHNELILIKGARQFALERVSLLLTEKAHKTRLEINLDAIRHNLLFYKSLLKPETKVMAVIKALAYGSGSTEVARLLEYNQIDYLAVAYADEGVALRKDGIKTPIMVMNPSEDDVYRMIRFNLEPEIYNVDQLSFFEKIFKSFNKKLPIHIVINTGMNRLGFDKEQIAELIAVLKSNEDITVKSLFSHLAASDEKEHEAFSLEQIQSFKETADSIKLELGYKPIVHILNSGGITRFPEHQLDMVRLGIGLHGVEVNHKYQDKLQKPAQLKTTISQIRYVTAGSSIGYGRKGKAERDMRIAVIAIGYADGYLRVFSNGNAYVSINGQKAKTIGNVCMDMTMIDVTDIDAKEGDEVVVFGTSPSVSELAEWAGTIPYEILTNVSSRVRRVFYSE